MQHLGMIEEVLQPPHTWEQRWRSVSVLEALLRAAGVAGHLEFNQGSVARVRRVTRSKNASKRRGGAGNR